MSFATHALPGKRHMYSERLKKRRPRKAPPSEPGRSKGAGGGAGGAQGYVLVKIDVFFCRSSRGPTEVGVVDVVAEKCSRIPTKNTRGQRRETYPGFSSSLSLRAKALLDA